MNPSIPPLTVRVRRRLAAALAVAVIAFLPAAAPARAAASAAGSTSASGYWMVASDGGIFSFGDARFFGSTGNIKLNKPIVGMAATPSGNGYWFVASDGGIFSFGDAGFFGSTGNTRLNKPIAGMASTPSGKGYWFTTSDGNVYPFGDAGFYGALSFRPSFDRSGVVAALVPTPGGAGYWQATATGQAFAFGDAADFGGLTQAPNLPIVGMTPLPAPAQLVPSGLPGAAPGVPVAPTPTTGGGTAPTTATTTPTAGTAPSTTTTVTAGTVPSTTTTVTTAPAPIAPSSGPSAFSSTAKVSWGTPNDPSRGSVNSAGETVYPYAQKVSAVAEIGDRVYIGGQFTDLVRNDTSRTPSGVPLAYLAELDADGIPVPGSRFNATVRLDGAVRALHRSPDGRRLYVGGDFRHVNGATRPRLVALDPATGEIDWSFNPPEPSGYVAAIAQSGPRLYIAGGFSRLGLATKAQLAALDAASGALDTGFVPPPRYTGRFEGHTGTANDNPVTNSDPTGVASSLLVTPGGEYLMVGGSFLHFGYDHTADPEHRHSGLVALDPVTGALTVWQPDQGSNSSRPVFGMTAYPGDPRTIGVNAPVLIFTASGGAGGRVLAWVPGKKMTRLWRGSMDGDVMAVAATRDRVYVVGHFDHTVPDPSDPCLKVRDLGDGHYGVSCPDGTENRHLAAFYASGEIVDGKNTGKSRIDTGFTAQADTSEGPYAVVVGANQLYVAGNFSKISATPVSSGGTRVKQPGFAIYPAIS